jgi:hypothetical protein
VALTQAQLVAREGKLTASAVGALMSGDQLKIMDLWRRMIGHPDYKEPNWDGMWPVQLGTVTEDLNLNWYERKYDTKVVRRGEVVVASDYPWAAATLDGWVVGKACPIECKHVGGYEPFDRIVERYTPQMTWQMLCCGTDSCVFSVIEGAKEPRISTHFYNSAYADEMLRRGRLFMTHVSDLTPPFIEDKVDAPPAPSREVSMVGSNAWAAHTADWLENMDGAAKAKKAEVNLKGAMPTDAARAFGHGVEITRDRAGDIV